MNCPSKLPEWFKVSAKDAKFKHAEVAKLFGFTEGGLFASVHEGRFPKPDERYKGITYRAHFWHKQTLINEFKRRRSINAQTDETPGTVAQVLQAKETCC